MCLGAEHIMPCDGQTAQYSVGLYIFVVVFVFRGGGELAVLSAPMCSAALRFPNVCVCLCVRVYMCACVCLCVIVYGHKPFPNYAETRITSR